MTPNREWDARAYHQISTPQQGWGKKVLARIELRGDETVLDAGCGSGRLTAELLSRLPRGRVVALDASADMLREARAFLAGDPRVSFVEADLATFTLPDSDDGKVDLIFSTATFHWVLDHAALFRQLHAALRPGGRLVAQFGGKGNLSRARTRFDRLAPELDNLQLTVYPDEQTTRTHAAAAGFVEIQTSLEDAPTPFADAAAFEAFTSRVVFGGHLARLSPGRGADIMRALVREFAADDPPFVLDYKRLNISGAKLGG